MLKTKFGKKLFSLLLALVCVFALAACQKEDPSQQAIADAKANAEQIHTQLIWDKTAMSQVTSDLKGFITTTKFENVTVAWESSKPDVIATDGKVTLPEYDDERAIELEPETEDSYALRVVEVKITAIITGVAEWEIDGKEYSKEIVLEKEFNFTVKTKVPADILTIKEAKAAAYEYAYVECGSQKGLVTNYDAVYVAEVTGVVTAVLMAENTYQFMIHDGTEGIYVYQKSMPSQVKVGDKVKVYGGIYPYYGSLQFGDGVSYEVLESGCEIPGQYKETTPQEVEDAAAALDADGNLAKTGYFGGELINVYGKLVAEDSGIGDDFYVADAQTGEKLWIYYKSYTPEGEAELAKYADKYVKVRGVTFDRDSRLNKCEMMWDGTIEEAEAPTLSDEEKANIALTEISVPALVEEDFELSADATWEVVSGDAIVLDGLTAKVTRPEAGAANAEVVLKATITVGKASASKEFTVAVKALPLVEGLVVAPQAGVGYKLKVVQENVSKDLYFSGEMNGYYYATTTNYAEAATIFLEAVEGGYNVYFLKGEVKQYLNVVQSGDYINVKIEAAASSVWTFNTEYNTLVTVLGEETYYIGCYKTYETISASKLSYAATSFVSHLHTFEPSKAEVKEPVADKEYKLGVYQANVEKWLYFKGEMNGYYYATTTNYAEAVSLYLAAVEGGYNVYFLKGEVKQYLNVVQSGDYINVKIEAAASSVWTFNTEYNTLVTVLGEETYYIGCYKTYETISASKISYAATSFVSHLYEVVSFGAASGEEVPHEHEFVNGECACGEKDPDYVAPEVQQITIAEALKVSEGTQVIIQGTVSSIYQAWSDQFSNISAYIKDETGEILVFRFGLKVVVGDVIKVTGTATVYNNVIQIAQGATVELVKAHEHSYGEDDKCVCGLLNPEHEHAYTDGRCVCGAADPDYVPEAGSVVKADLDTIKSTSTAYTKSTTTAGWVAENSAVLSGGASNSNPTFSFISSDTTLRAVCLNGKTSAKGKLTSPTLSGGLSKVTFDYGLPFSDTKISLTINVIQNGEVVATHKVENLSASKQTVYTLQWTLETPVEGEYSIEIVNNSPSNNTGNKDRTAIWNLELTAK